MTPSNGEHSVGEGIHICGGTSHLPLLRGRPENLGIDDSYKAIVPFNFKWRAKLGKVECDCKEIIESFQPWYGFTFYHSDECAIVKHLERYPQMQNFFWDRDPKVIAQSE